MVSRAEDAGHRPAQLGIRPRLDHPLSAHGHRGVAGQPVRSVFGANLGLAVFLIQLALNLGWSWLFFHRHAIGGALAELVVLWVAIGVTTLIFSGVSPAWAYLMAPYWAWVSFATALNAAFWRLN
jgi:translocator protein